MSLVLAQALRNQTPGLGTTTSVFAHCSGANGGPGVSPLPSSWVLTGAVSSLALPAIFDERKEIGSSVSQSILGLVFLIALFGAYLTYEKVLINRLRLELAQGQFHSAFWRNLALLDPLTGLYNRRYAERRLKAEIARSERKGCPLILVVFDLNNFKQINDRFGHSAGDLVLQEFADRL